MPYRVRTFGVTIPTTAPPLTDQRTLRYTRPTNLLIKNQGSTSVWVRTDGVIATTAQPSVEVPAGQSWQFILTPENGDAVVSMIAATSSVNVILQEMSFRSSLIAELVGAVYALVLTIVQGLWQFVSGSTTAIEPRGSVTQARADAFQNKTAATDVTLSNRDTTTAGVAIGAGPNHGLSNGSVTIGLGGNGIEVASTATDVRVSGTTYARFDSSGLDIESSKSLTVGTGTVGSSTPRHTLNSTHRIRRLLANGAATQNQVLDASEWPITNGQTINAGDLVELTADGTVRSEQLNSTGIVGVAVSGGTGDAGGTVRAVVSEWGFLANTLVADDAGVTAGDRGFGGATTVNEIASQAAIEGTFCRVLETGASGVAVSVFLNGTH